MTQSIETVHDQLDRDGFAVMNGIYSPDQVDAVLSELTAALARPADGDALIRNDEGSLYGARNIAQLWPQVRDVWRVPELTEVLEGVLGPCFGLVRVLYFDKPPGRSWALPWHKDLTVAVRDNRLPSQHFGKPTRKAGVPHAEAPLDLLERMLTARVHLDDVTEENGPLRVLPGSHRTGKALRVGDATPHSVLVNRGDVLLMRPLLAHCSNAARRDTTRHRRILHLEFAATPELPDGYEWWEFVPA